jgi:GDP/UDP-N,N'-diacetylbacillosamine 2-epimerase (hydrolysing)
MSVIIIAEAGVNHNGDIDMARRLIDAAAAAGADFVKFQTYRAEQLVTRDAAKADYQKRNDGEMDSQFEMLKRLELTPQMHYELINHCVMRGISFLSTGFDRESVDFLHGLGLPLFKIPSGEITNLPYLRHIGSLGKPIIMSTGMATLEEVGAALDVLQKAGAPRSAITVLHCTTDYPAAAADVNLHAMAAIRDAFGVAVGYSDHTQGVEVSLAAAALGASVIEKHFTLDHDLPGPDHKASLEPDQLKFMVSAIRNIESALGDGVKRPTPAELRNLPIARKSLVAARDIKSGEIFTAENLAVKRPGTGISPMRMDEILGRNRAMKRKICVFTGTRAEYGLLRWLMTDIQADPALELQLLVSGAHLSPEFGLTYREIEADGLRIDRKVEMLLSSDNAVGIAKSMALGLSGYAEAFDELRPDILVLLGDRFETFAAAAAALVAKIPVAHLHGGEITQGAFDDALRHAITKMSHLHFVALDAYRRRVIQLGEAPDNVFVVGGLGIDGMVRQPLLTRAELEKSLELRFAEKNLLITFHPATLEDASPAAQLEELFAALDRLENTLLLFTLPNADTGGRTLMNMVNAFAAARPDRARAFASLGQQRYLSCLQLVDAVVGNSSSGILEAPSFGIGTIDIGKRQLGRLKAESVIECDPERGQIGAALEKLYSPGFQARLQNVSNPYGDGTASKRILEILRTHPLDKLIMKRFHDQDGPL